MLLACPSFVTTFMIFTVPDTYMYTVLTSIAVGAFKCNVYREVPDKVSGW